MSSARIRAGGEALFLKDVFRDAKMLSFIEFFYRAEGADFGFDPEFSEDAVAGRCRLRMKNANSLLNIDAADWCVSPTLWQASTVPLRYRDRVPVIYRGGCQEGDVGLAGFQG
jgi:hypothetical protein